MTDSKPSILRKSPQNQQTFPQHSSPPPKKQEINKAPMTPYLDNFPPYGYDLRSYQWCGNHQQRGRESFFAQPSIWPTLNNGSV